MITSTRREFLQGAAAGAAALAWPSVFAQESKSPWKVGGFTKLVQELPFDKTVQLASDLGWDGIECPVRAKGQILPDRAEEDLPKMVEALKAKGLEILLMASDVTGVDQPLTEKVLRAASKAGIRLYRLGFMHYKDGTPIPKQMEEIRAKLKDLAALNKDLGLTGLIENHSGAKYVGGAVWDLYELIKDIDPGQMGVQYDIGHATVEGGMSWPTAFSLIKDRIRAVIVKDFTWTFTPGAGSKVQWCSVGKGTINPKFFGMLKAAGFQGPITLHFEQPIENKESLDARVAVMKQDTASLRGLLKG